MVSDPRAATVADLVSDPGAGTMATSVLLEQVDNGLQRTFKVSPDKVLIIGRESTTKPQPQSSTEARYRSAVMSSKHAEIMVGESGNQVYLVDTDSRHGTTVNGQKLIPQVAKELSPGDLLMFGVRVDRSPGVFYDGVKIIFRGANSKEERHQEEVMVQCNQQRRSTFSVPGDEDENESDVESDFAQEIRWSEEEEAEKGPMPEEEVEVRVPQTELLEDLALSSQISQSQDNMDGKDDNHATDDVGASDSVDDDSSARVLSPELGDEIYQPKPGFRVDMVTGRETYAQSPLTPDHDAAEDTNPQLDRRFDVAPNGVPTFTKNDVALAKAKHAANKINARILGQQECELGMNKMALDWYSHEHASNIEALHDLRAAVVELEGQLAGKKRKAEDTDERVGTKRQAVAAEVSLAEAPVRSGASGLPGVTLGRALGIVALGATAALFCEWGVC